MSRIRTLLLASLLALATVVGPGSSTALAQQGDGDCYPPASPECDPDDEPGRAASVSCEVRPAAREVACSGEGFESGSEAELELRGTGPSSDGNVVASGSTTVAEDGTFDVAAALPCDYDRDRVLARTSGTSDRGQPVTFTEQVDVSDVEPCDDAVLGEGLERGAPDDGGGEGPGGLAFTGFDWLLLALVAAALIAVGSWLVRRRRDGA